MLCEYQIIQIGLAVRELYTETITFDWCVAPIDRSVMILFDKWMAIQIIEFQPVVPDVSVTKPNSCIVII